jgi:hypothetical protein
VLIDHITVNFPHHSGLARDQVVNTWTFAAEADLDAGMLTTLESALTDFYNGNTVAGTGLSVANFIGPTMSRTIAPTFKHYDLDGHLNGTAVGSPVRVQPMALLGAGNGGTGLPAEVSCCLSSHADFGTDAEFGPGGLSRPRARDRGRVYIGPLSATGCISQEATTLRPYVSDSLRNTLIDAGRRLFSFPSLPASWVVWSRKAAAVKNVVAISVDDAFDTQRRRGERPNVRTTWTLP